MNNWYFTADEHYGHPNAIAYCNRPFPGIETMDRVLIENFNSKVSPSDITVHVGDFSLAPWEQVKGYLKQLNGSHIFVKGNHDWWLKKSPLVWKHIWSHHFKGLNLKVVCCHYAMRTWQASNHGSWQLHGHSHGSLRPIGRQQDVGVDVWNYFPVALEELLELPHLQENRDDCNEIEKGAVCPSRHNRSNRDEGGATGPLARYSDSS